MPAGRLVHIIDPAEEDFPFPAARVSKPCTGERDRILGRAESVAGEYRARFKAHAEAVAHLARRLGWNYLAHRTDRSPQTALVALYADLARRTQDNRVSRT